MVIHVAVFLFQFLRIFCVFTYPGHLGHIESGALAKLDLSGNNQCDSESPSFIRPIATMLKNNTSIKELNLAGNKLNAKAARILCQDTQGMEALATLNLANNKLGVEGARHLAEVLPTW